MKGCPRLCMSVARNVGRSTKCKDRPASKKPNQGICHDLMAQHVPPGHRRPAGLLARIERVTPTTTGYPRILAEVQYVESRIRCHLSSHVQSLYEGLLACQSRGTLAARQSAKYRPATKKPNPRYMPRPYATTRTIAM
jgi:hypothetical protein